MKRLLNASARPRQIKKLLCPYLEIIHVHYLRESNCIPAVIEFYGISYASSSVHSMTLIYPSTHALDCITLKFCLDLKDFIEYKHIFL